MTTEEMARELISVVRTGEPTNDERMRIALLAYEHGLKSLIDGGKKERAA